LTLFVFSSENWKRSKMEVNYLMKLLGQALDKKNIEEFYKQGTKIKVIGQRERLPLDLQKKIKETEELTKNNRAWF